MKIDADSIKKLAALLDETGLNEIEISDDDKSIRVSRGGNMVHVSGHAPAVGAMASDPAVPQPANTSAPDTTAHTTHPGAVTSPMVGTAYLQPEPGAPPFIQKGSTVKPGDTLMIIEAMKVMNPIKAETAGTISHIMVDNGQPVEFGDVLMVIEE